MTTQEELDFLKTAKRRVIKMIIDLKAMQIAEQPVIDGLARLLGCIVVRIHCISSLSTAEQGEDTEVLQAVLKSLSTTDQLLEGMKEKTNV